MERGFNGYTDADSFGFISAAKHPYNLRAIIPPNLTKTSQMQFRRRRIFLFW